MRRTSHFCRRLNSKSLSNSKKKKKTEEWRFRKYDKMCGLKWEEKSKFIILSSISLLIMRAKLDFEPKK